MPGRAKFPANRWKIDVDTGYLNAFKPRSGDPVAAASEG
jgi:hypothetical protein